MQSEFSWVLPGERKMQSVPGVSSVKGKFCDDRRVTLKEELLLLYCKQVFSSGLKGIKTLQSFPVWYSILRCWPDGWTVKSMGLILRHLHGGLQPFVNPSPGDPALFWHVDITCILFTDIHAGKICMYVKNKLKNYSQGIIIFSYWDHDNS